MLNINNISVSSLRSNDFKSYLPEIYSLTSLIENNPWHINQSVFDHTLLVYQSYLEEVLQLSYVNAEQKVKIDKHLSASIGTKSKLELGKIAVLFHDIGKIHTHTMLPVGTTVSPYHDHVGAGMFPEIAPRFGLSNAEEKWVSDFILNHSFIFEIISFCLNGRGDRKYLTVFKSLVGDQSLDLLLFFYSDLKGSDLFKIDSDKFMQVEKKIIDLLCLDLDDNF